MEPLHYRSSKSWQLRNKLMAVTLLLSEMEMFDKQSCDMCPYCTGKRKSQPQQNRSTVPVTSTKLFSSDKPTYDKSTTAKPAERIIEETFDETATTMKKMEYEESPSSLHDKIQIYSAAQAQLNKTIEKGRSLKNANNFAPVHKSVGEREHVWLLQDQVSRGTSSSCSTSSDTDSGHLTGSDSSEYFTAPSKASSTFVLKVSSV